MNAAVQRLKIKVVPGAARDEIAGWLGAELKVRIAAPPERGRANRAVVELVAAALGLPKSKVSIRAGATRARKTLEIEGLDAAELARRLDCVAGARAR